MSESDGAQGRFHGLEGRVYKVAVALLLVLVEREAHPPAPFTERRILGIWGTVDAGALMTLICRPCSSVGHLSIACISGLVAAVCTIVRSATFDDGLWLRSNVGV